MALQEDQLLTELVKKFGAKRWAHMSRFFLQAKSGKQCRERWINQLDPEVVKANWTQEEDRIITEMVEKEGTKWAKIARCLKGR